MANLQTKFDTSEMNKRYIQNKGHIIVYLKRSGGRQKKVLFWVAFSAYYF